MDLNDFTSAENKKMTTENDIPTFNPPIGGLNVGISFSVVIFLFSALVKSFRSIFDSSIMILFYPLNWWL